MSTVPVKSLETPTNDEAPVTPVNLLYPRNSYPETPTITHGELAKMSKADQIRILVKEHVAHSKECQKEALLGATPHLRSLLTGAQASQKALQKLINNEEIERYRQGMEPLGRKEDLLPFSGSEERHLQAPGSEQTKEQGALCPST
ncbi:hypothetical protein Pst134EB_016397 [Puccinia striiformis f. sp. tritici]|nr:hypothetical protein Pst134EB_016397 [Puccinia striiformis f. sp. tritici]